MTESSASAGSLLRECRLKQRLSITECSKRTHIASRYLEALEEEHWDQLPSESHRLGFLRSYSRFLGAATEDVMRLYQQRADTSASPAPALSGMSSGPAKASSTPGWFPTSWSQVVILGIAVLTLGWALYHTFYKPSFEPRPTTLVRLPSRPPRLVTPRAAPAVQRIRIQAQSDSWIRVMENRTLLFEGILPAGLSKQWSGTGPFYLKMGNIQAISLFWNDQPVDVQTGAHGRVNDLQLPLPK